MHHECPAPCPCHRVDEPVEIGLSILVVDPDPALDGDRHLHRPLHLRKAARDEIGLAHQAGAEPSFLHAARRAPDIEIDLAIAEVGPDPRRLGELGRARSPELQCHRLLSRIEPEQPLAIAVHDRRTRNHLGIKQRPRRQPPMERPAMPVRPIHHRGDAEFYAFDIASVSNGL